MALLGHLASDVQHVGSTAVVGLDAKPILDIAVALDPDHSSGTNEIVRRMEAGGYEYQGDQGPDGGLLFVRATGDVRTVHVHMVPADDPGWTSYIRFRDYLRATPQRRGDYQQLERQLATRYAADREAYTEAKTAFVLETLRLAEKQTTAGESPPRTAAHPIFEFARARYPPIAAHSGTSTVVE